MSFSPTKTGLAVILILAVWATYRLILTKLYPRVLPGVPHNPHHAKRILGDMPAVAAYASKMGRTQSEAVFQVINRNPTTQSTIAQLLTPSFMGQQTILMIDDPREVEDILRRRGREFDRSAMTAAFFDPLLPRASISQFTTPELKAQKKLWADSITSDFLNRVVAPHACRTAGRLVDIWRLKAAGVGGEAFEAQPYFLDTTMDLMWTVVLGSDLGVLSDRLQSTARELKTQRPHLENVGDDGGTSRNDILLGKLDRAAEPSRRMFFSVTDFLEHESSYIRSGSAAWRLKFVKFTPRYRRVKNEMIREMQRLVAAARDRFQNLGRNQGAGWDAEETCAMDLVLRRELLAAGKDDFVQATNIEQELMLFMIAGIDSTAFTLAWCVKFLSSYLDVQHELRQALKSAFFSPPDSDGQRLPSANDIVTRNIPYIDAFIQEALRFAVTAGSVVRRVTIDTQVLGCRIPAGTELVLNTRVLKKPLPVDENLRSPTSREAQRKRPRGGIEGPSGDNLESFNPRRWLYLGEDGTDAFDAEALPTLLFSHGIRGCFGKRLAMNNLRVFVVILVLSFEFLPVPEEGDKWAAEEEIFRHPKHSLWGVLWNRGKSQPRRPVLLGTDLHVERTLIDGLYNYEAMDIDGETNSRSYDPMSDQVALLSFLCR